MHFTTGVVQGLHDLIECFTEKGDQILIQPPVYYPFFNVIEDQQRELLTSNHHIFDTGKELPLVLLCARRVQLDYAGSKEETASPHFPLAAAGNEPDPFDSRPLKGSSFPVSKI
jgi:hypothetical protein